MSQRQLSILNMLCHQNKLAKDCVTKQQFAHQFGQAWTNTILPARVFLEQYAGLL
jgi:hypothetical protein